MLRNQKLVRDLKVKFYMYFINQNMIFRILVKSDFRNFKINGVNEHSFGSDQLFWPGLRSFYSVVRKKISHFSTNQKPWWIYWMSDNASWYNFERAHLRSHIIVLFNLIQLFFKTKSTKVNEQRTPIVGNKGNNKITEHRAIFQRERQNS
jgi:hypothetical protein